MCRFCSVPLPVPNPDCHILFLCFLFGGICAVLCCAGLQCAFLKNKQKKNQTFFFLVLGNQLFLGKEKKFKFVKRNFTYTVVNGYLRNASSLTSFVEYLTQVKGVCWF